MIKLLTFCFSVVFVLNLQADTTDSKWKNIIELKKTGDHCKDDANCFNRYHPAIQPRATAEQGDIIVLHTRDALDSNYSFDAVAEDVPTFNLGEVHPMTGPVYIKGSKRGDALEVELLDIVPDEYGYTVIVPGFGFLRVQPTLRNKRKINNNFIFKLIFSESKSHFKCSLFIALKGGIDL